jgi:hypothetical protein
MAQSLRSRPTLIPHFDMFAMKQDRGGYRPMLYCINQQDNDEKAQQVTRIGDVYKIAHSTIIYLGEATPASNAVIAC